MGASSLVLFTLVAVGAAANVSGGAGGPLAVLIIAVLSCECGMLVSKKTKVDIIVTPLVTIAAGVFFTLLFASHIGKAAYSFGNLIMWATTLKPFLMGILISVIVGILLTLPVSSAAVCAALGLTGLAGGAAVAGLLSFARLTVFSPIVCSARHPCLGVSGIFYLNLLVKSLR